MLSLHNMFDRNKIKRLVEKMPKGLMSIMTILLITYLSLDDNPFDANDVRLFEGMDKVVHCIMYWFLALILMIDWTKIKNYIKISAVSMWVCVAIAFAFSALMEYLQDAMGLGRAASWADALANFTGTILGFLSMKFVFNKWFFDTKQG